MIGTLSRRSSTSPHLLGGYRDAREEYQEKFNVTLKGFGLLKGIKVLVGIIILAVSLTNKLKKVLTSYFEKIELIVNLYRRFSFSFIVIKFISKFNSLTEIG